MRNPNTLHTTHENPRAVLRAPKLLQEIKTGETKKISLAL